jgi:hypothetical protein
MSVVAAWDRCGNIVGLSNSNMSELPKIALARLRAKAQAPRASGAPVGPPAFQGAEHPDANLLAALAENALTEKERNEVLTHLSQCAHCREVAAFIVPPDAVVVSSAREAEARRFHPWRLLRWGAMAAVLGMLAMVVVLHPSMWRQNREIAKSIPPPNPAENITGAPPAGLMQPAPAAPSKAATGGQADEVKEIAREEEQYKKSMSAHQNRATTDQTARLRASDQVTVMASSQPPPPLRAENVPSVGVERKESLGDNAISAMARPAPPPPTASPAEPMTATGAAGKATGEPAGAEIPHSMTQSVEVTSVGGLLGGGTRQGLAGAGGSTRSAHAQAEAAKPAAQANAQVTAQAPMLDMEGIRSSLKSKVRLPATIWSVSPEGKVQRSQDGSKTFQSVEVARGTKFQAVAASGDDVWAGGVDGALFHSADAGATWTQVAITANGTAVNETISAIQLHDSQHLAVTTASGSVWASEDAGQHWKKQE